jgi:hypothetical protein
MLMMRGAAAEFFLTYNAIFSIIRSSKSQPLSNMGLPQGAGALVHVRPNTLASILMVVRISTLQFIPNPMIISPKPLLLFLSGHPR